MPTQSLETEHTRTMGEVEAVRRGVGVGLVAMGTGFVSRGIRTGDPRIDTAVDIGGGLLFLGGLMGPVIAGIIYELQHPEINQGPNQ